MKSPAKSGGRLRGVEFRRAVAPGEFSFVTINSHDPLPPNQPNNLRLIFEHVGKEELEKAKLTIKVHKARWPWLAAKASTMALPDPRTQLAKAVDDPSMNRREARVSFNEDLTTRSAGLGTSAFATGARGLALLRGREHMEALLAEAGGTFDQDQVQTMLYGISRQAIDKRVREGSLLAVPGPNGARRYPVCQFLADGSLIKGLKEVQAALPVRGPWSAFLFLMQPQDGLNGQKPLDALRAGDLARVLAAAERLGVQGS